MRQELANPSPLLLAALIEPAALSRVARVRLKKLTTGGEFRKLSTQKQATSRAAFLGTGLPTAAPRGARRSNLAQVRIS